MSRISVLLAVMMLQPGNILGESGEEMKERGRGAFTRMMNQIDENYKNTSSLVTPLINKSKTLEQENIALTSRVDGLEEENNVLMTRTSATEKGIEDLTKRVVTLEQQKHAMSTQIDAVVQENSALSARINTLEKEKNALTTKVNDVEKTLTKKIEVLEEEKSALATKVSAIEKFNEEVERHIHVCPDPKEISVPANSYLDRTTNNRHEEVVVRFPCNDGFYQCGQEVKAICQPNGQWSVSGSSKCVERTFKIDGSTISNNKFFPCGLPVGALVTITGYPTETNTFTLNLVNDKNEICFHSSIRMKWSYIAANTLIGNRWGAQKDYGYRPFPFKTGEEFAYIIDVRQADYKVTKDGKQLFVFASSDMFPTGIRCGGAAKFHAVEVTYPI